MFVIITLLITLSILLKEYYSTMNNKESINAKKKKLRV